MTAFLETGLSYPFRCPDNEAASRSGSFVGSGGRRQEEGGRRQEPKGRRQETKGRRQGAGGRRQGAEGRRPSFGEGSLPAYF